MGWEARGPGSTLLHYSLARMLLLEGLLRIPPHFHQAQLQGKLYLAEPVSLKHL